MADAAPRLFVASSQASLPLARRIAAALAPEIEARVWADCFEPGDDTLDNLVLFASLHEFGVFVLGADDLTQRGDPASGKDGARRQPRDNVIFELGLFMGVLGRRRALTLVVEADDAAPEDKVRLPSDLAGNTYLRIDAGQVATDEGARAKLANLRSILITRSRAAPRSLLPATSLAQGYFNNFIAPVIAELERLIEGGAALDTSAGPVDVAGRGYRFTVVLPPRITKAIIAERDARFRAAGLATASLPPGAKAAGRRAYDFYVAAHDAGGPVRLFDLPTTLRSARDAIEFVVPEGAPGEREPERELLAARELSVFSRVLADLAADNLAVKIAIEPLETLGAGHGA